MATPSGKETLPPFEPDVFGKFFMLQRLAVGGMGEVVRAKTVGAGGFQKELVVKRILPSLARDGGFAQMLVNEAKLTVGLNHPNIAQIHELGRIDGTYFIAMDMVEGLPLSELGGLFRGERSPLTAEHALWVVYEALKGLDYAHRATGHTGDHLGIVHCDMSPDNIMITFDAGVKVVDFGIARAAMEGMGNWQAGTVMGKINYLPPEQATGQQVDPRSDLYSVGVVLYQLLTGGFPYGHFGALEELVPLVSGTARYTSVTAHNPRLPAELDPVLQRAVALDPEDRYQNAQSLMVAIEELLYPTPHSTLTEHLRVATADTFSPRREKMSQARARDAMLMKQLAKRMATRGGGRPDQPTGGDIALAVNDPLPARQTRGAAVEAPPPRRHLTAVSAGLAVVLAILFAGAVQLLQPWISQGALVVQTTPPGATVFLDDEAEAATSPTVIKGLWRGTDHVVRVELEGYQAQTRPLAGGREAAAVIDFQLAPTHGSVRIVSTPRGATVAVDGERRGKTPLTLESLDLTESHKLTLKLKGHELDESLLENLEADAVVKRRLRKREE